MLLGPLDRISTVSGMHGTWVLQIKGGYCIERRFRMEAECFLWHFVEPRSWQTVGKDFLFFTTSAALLRNLEETGSLNQNFHVSKHQKGFQEKQALSLTSRPYLVSEHGSSLGMDRL